MCGATSAQTQLQNEEMQSLQEYDQIMQQQYANQQELYSTVNSVLQPILKAGPNQEGFSEGELNTLNAQAVQGTGENYEQGARAVNEQIAAEGGGNSPVTTGGAQQLKEEVAASAANSESQEELGIKQADYAQGYSEFENAEQGEMAIAAGENPLGWAGAATSQGNSANQEANAVAAEQNSWVNALMGAAGSIGGSISTPGGWSF